MTNFIFMVSTILLRGWRQQKQPSRKHFASVQMPAKHTGREHFIFIMDISITTALWLNWKLHAGACPMIRGYSFSWVSSKGVRGAGKNLLEISSGHLNSTRATLEPSTTSEIVTEASAVMLNKNRTSIAYWPSSRTIS